MRNQFSLTEQLAEYWSAACYDRLPDEVVAMAKRVLLDTLCVGVRGRDGDASRATLAGISAVLEGKRGSATVWGTDENLPASAAALVNGTSTHAYEFDDYGGCGHSGAVVIPAVCAVAEKARVDGRRVILAVVAGYDVAARVTEGAGGYRPHNDHGWHSTGTCGTFGAAAGAASILGLRREQYAAALGVAGSYAGGTWAFLADGAMTKRFHPGRASENGVTAAFLAEAGLIGPRYILDAAWGGFFATYCGPAATPNAAVAALGSEFRIFTTGMKPYPCCRGLHSSIDALLDLLTEEEIEYDDIDQILVHGAERTVRQFRNYRIETVLDGQFSLPYALAAATVSGASGLDEFFPPKPEDPRVGDLMKRVDVVADRSLGPYDEPDIEIRGRKGEIWKRHVPVPRGAPARPLDDAFLSAKSQAVAVPVIGRRHYDELRLQIAHLEDVSDFRQISSLLRPG